MNDLNRFTPNQMNVIGDAVSMAEDIAIDYFKMSASQWRRLNYDIKTLEALADSEIVHGPFAQVVRYEGKPIDANLGSQTYDFYKICLQDHSIIETLNQLPDIRLKPFMIYIAAHELIHIVRFCKFLQNFNASPEQRHEEELRVHEITRNMLDPLNISGMSKVLGFYRKWESPMEAVI